MTKDVIITVCGLQMAQDGDNEPIELVTTGEYFFKNNKHYLIYEEIVDGESMVSKNRIKATQDYLELTKSGATTVHMVFEAGKKNVTHYFTPYGSLARTRRGAADADALLPAGRRLDERDADARLCHPLRRDVRHAA